MDFGEAIRPIFFQTDYEDFLYATYGGTAFVVKFRDRLYALTCGHVFGDFRHGALFITDEKHAKKGAKPAPITGLCFPSAPRGDAEATDVTDICVIEFDAEIAPDFFKGSEFVINESSVATAAPGHELLVAGVLKEKTRIDPPDITIGYCRLQLRDAGVVSSDPTLRLAVALFAEPAFSSITGISSAPVFDQTAQKLCGMVVRGGMNGTVCSLWYVDIFDIVQLLEDVSRGATNHDYVKLQTRPVSMTDTAIDSSGLENGVRHRVRLANIAIKAVERKTEPFSDDQKARLMMRYRDIEYSLVQGLGRHLWKWSASVAHGVITGQAHSKSAAVVEAEKAIDRALAPKKTRLVPLPGRRD